MGRVATPGVEGFICVLKPFGWTSHDVVQLLRKLTGVRRVGHGGTLDPAASGVLLVAIGRATRLIDYLADQDKIYCADVVLGASTDTDDADGAVLSVRDPSWIGVSEIFPALSTFLGEISQVPPQYSAVKLQGRKAYEVARRGGTSELAPRKIVVNGIAMLEWESPVLSILVHCSKGTYIRSIARDLGQRLGSGAHLGALVRVASGRFTCEDAVSIEDLKLATEFGYLDNLVWPPDAAVAHLPALVVSQEHEEDMASGRKWQSGTVGSPGRVRVYSEGGGFLGLAEHEDGMWQPRVVITEES